MPSDFSYILHLQLSAYPYMHSWEITLVGEVSGYRVICKAYGEDLRLETSIYADVKA